MRISLDDDETPEISLVALIDCIFFLLMFYMVATTFRVQNGTGKEGQLPVQLPSSAVSVNASSGDAPRLIIGVDTRGVYYLSGKAVALEVLRAELRRVAATDPGRAIQIEADRQTAFQNVVKLLDQCEVEGLRQVTFRTRR